MNIANRETATEGTKQTQSGLIELRSVSKTYRGGGGVKALHDINLIIRPGELLAIVGPSGSGKTTLTHIIGGLIQPSSGEVHFNGSKLPYRSDKSMSAYRNKTIGFVFQNYSLLPYYTAIENVMMPLIVAGIKPSIRRQVAMQYLQLVGLEKLAKRRSDQLSGGQRQRVGIARALTMKPSLIIADEPTGNLDTAHGNEIMAVLEKLAHSKNIAVIMVTHNDELAKRADRIIHIVDGKVTEARHARI